MSGNLLQVPHPYGLSHQSKRPHGCESRVPTDGGQTLSSTHHPLGVSPLAPAGFMHYSVTKVTLQWPWWCPSHSLRMSPGRADKEQEAEWLWTHLPSAEEPGAVAAWGWALFAGKAEEVRELEGMVTAAEGWPSGSMVMPVVWAFYSLFTPFSSPYRPPPECIFWVYWKIPPISVFKALNHLLTLLILKITLYINGFLLNLACSAVSSSATVEFNPVPLLTVLHTLTDPNALLSPSFFYWTHAQ